MQHITKRLLSILIVAALLLAGLPASLPQAIAADSDSVIFMHYDDRLPVTAFGVSNGADLTVSNQKVTSHMVGSTAADGAVVTVEGNRLIAVGTGTAIVTAGGMTYTLRVEPAPISLVMITGHSIGAGQDGIPGASVLCEDGQAYSTYAASGGGAAYASAVTQGVGIGYGSAQKPADIDAFTSLGSGTKGSGSAIAYRWNQLTGEKIWVLNAAMPGSTLIHWVEGAEQYVNAVHVFRYAQTVLKNEIAAGHYTLRDMALIYHGAANWGYAGNGSYTDTQGKKWFDSMLNGFKRDFTTDMNGDGKTETVTAVGMVPLWNVERANTYRDDAAATFFMSASQQYPEVFMASLATRTWVRDISQFPNPTYETHGTPVTTPTKAEELFTDTVHLQQSVSNASGIDIAENLYAKLRGSVTASYLNFRTNLNGAVQSSYTLAVGEKVKLVPEVTPIAANDLTFTVSENLRLEYPCTVKAVSGGAGTLTVSQGSNVLATIHFTVTGEAAEEPENPDPSGQHCICGADVRGEAHTENCYVVEDSRWIRWDNTNSLPTTPGYYKLTEHIYLETEKTVPSGDVVLDLNGYTVTQTANGARVYQLAGGSLTITDTSKTKTGKLLPAASGVVHGGIVYTDTGTTLNIYGGLLDASGATTGIGAGLCLFGSCNMYGGILKGGNTTGTGGGAVLVYGGSFRMTGGEIIGGNLSSGTGSAIRGSSDGCTIYIGGNAVIRGGSIPSGSNGGTISIPYSAKKRSLTIGGNATVYGVAATNGGAVYVEGGNVTLEENARIVGGSATRGGAIYMGNSGVLTVNGGTVIGAASANGGAIYVAGSSQVAVNGGQILGGKTSSHGGGIYLETGTVHMYGGEVHAPEGSAVSKTGGAVYVYNGTFYLHDGLVVAGNTSDYGGAISLNHKNAKLYIYGGTVTAQVKNADGSVTRKTASAGTGVGIWGGTVVMTGGEIVGGDCSHYASGAAVCVHGDANTASFTMSGGVIRGGRNTGSGAGNLGLYGAGNKFVMTGGLITEGVGAKGGVNIRNDQNCIVEVSGTAQIIGNTDRSGNPMNLYICSGKTVTVGANGLQTGARIGVTMAAIGVFTSATNSTGFVSDNGAYRVAAAAGGLSLQTVGSVYHCLCADPESTGNPCAEAGHTEIEWKPWYDRTALPAEGGYYYLTTNVTLTASREIAEDELLAIDLNGWTVGGTGKHIFDMTNNTDDGSVSSNAASHLILTDSVGCGRIDGSKATMPHGRAIFLETGTWDFYGGTVTGHSGTSTGTVNSRFNSTCVVNMYGGAVDGGNGDNGGAVHWRGGTFNLYGGEIRGGTAINTPTPQGGNVALLAGTFRMYGGRITGGTATKLGGNLVVQAGAFYMHGGEISNGTAGMAGNLWVSGGSFFMDGGRIENGEVIYYDGSFTVSGSAKISQLRLANNKLLSVAVLADDAAIVIDAPDGVVTTSPLPMDQANRITAYRQGKYLYPAASGLFLVNTPADGSDAVKLGDAILPLEVAAYLAGEGGFVTLFREVSGDVYLPVSLYVDLNGHTLSGNVIIAEQAVLSLFDSKTADYTAENRGKLTGKVEGNLARVCNTPSAYGHNYKYLTLQEKDGSWSAHRVYLSVKSATLRPYTKDGAAVGTAASYKTVFRCSDFVASHVAAYGAQLTGDATVAAPYENYAVTGGSNEGTVWLLNTLSTANTDAVNAQNAEAAPVVSAYIQLADGFAFASSGVSRSLKDLVISANAMTELTLQQKAALGAMYAAFRNVMDAWTDADISNIKGYSEKRF